MEKVLDFQPDGVASPWSWATLSSNISLLSNGVNSLAALTLCVRVFLPFYRNMHTLLTISTDESTNYLSVVLGKEGVYLTIGDQLEWAPIFAVPGYWNTLCSQIDFIESMWMLQMNEKDFSTSLNVTSDVTSTTVFIVLGQRLNKYQNGYISDSSYRGKLTDFNMWNRLLNSEELSLFANCEPETEGLLVKWEPEKLILNGSTSIVDIPREKVCRPAGVYKVLLSPPLLLPVAESICRLLRGNLSTEGDVESSNLGFPQLMALRTEDSEKKTRNIVQQRSEKGSKFSHEKEKWRRIKNLMKKDTVSRWNTETLVTTSSKTLQIIRTAAEINKTNTNPSKQVTEPMLRQTFEEDAIFVEERLNEELDFVAYCEFYEPPIFRVNGFCPDLLEIVDENYIVIGKQSEGELPLFQGFTGRKITYSKGMWVATTEHNKYMELWFEDPIRNPTLSPIGRNIWLIMITVNEELLKKDVELPCDSEYVFLNLSPCPKGYFTCSDATCLPHPVRCDRKADCLDTSDEDFCFKVDVPSENRDDLPVKPMEGNNVTEVELKVLIIGAKIELDVMTISADIWMTWKDPSLVFYNLRDDPLSNLVDVPSLNEIWMPTLEFGHNKKKKIIMSNKSEVFILKESFGSVEDYEFSWEAMSYKGPENSLQLRERVEVDAKCIFNTFLFPFGLQQCSFPFVLISALPDAVKLASSEFHGGVSWSRSNDDLKYDISSIELMPKEGNMYSTQELVVKIYPRLGLAFLTMYFPSLFIIIIGISSFYISPAQLQTRMVSALACLIALLILQIQVGSPLLGKTGVNAGDIWLFGAFIIVFAINVSHVRIAKDIYVIEEKRPTTRQIVPVNMMNGKIDDVPQSQSLSVFANALSLSKRCRIIITVVTIILIIIYVIVFIILTAIYKT